jgi:hypothetical protein
MVGAPPPGTVLRLGLLPAGRAMRSRARYVPVSAPEPGGSVRGSLSACALLESADLAPLVVSCARRCAAGLLRLGR